MIKMISDFPFVCELSFILKKPPCSTGEIPGVPKKQKIDSQENTWPDFYFNMTVNNLNGLPPSFLMHLVYF